MTLHKFSRTEIFFEIKVEMFFVFWPKCPSFEVSSQSPSLKLFSRLDLETLFYEMTDKPDGRTVERGDPSLEGSGQK